MKQSRLPLTRFRLLLQIMVIGFASTVASAADEPVKSRILLIYGSTDIGEWEQIFNTAIVREISVTSNLALAPEFLSLVGSDEIRQDLNAQSLQLQYSDSHIDLVISVMPEAATFINEWSGVFAPGAPRLYVLPGTDIINNTELPASDTILISSVEVAAEKTLQLVVELFPELTDIYVAGGSGEGDYSYADRVANAVVPSGIDIEPEFILGLPGDELVERLRDVPTSSAIIMSTYDIDYRGQPQRSFAINRLLSSELDIPTFALFDSQMGSGSIGGNMSSAVDYATGTAELAKNILAGGPVARINTAPTKYIFDGEWLNNFDIDRNLLPAERTIINDQPDFIAEHLPWIITAFVVIAIQLILIALLLRAVSQRRLAEKELETTQKMEALGSLAGGIAHDFNNILMAIMANAELAKALLTDPEAANTRLSNIVSASNRAKGLISQILLFSRQSASQSYAIENPEALLKESAEQISAFLPRDCKLVLNCDAVLPRVSVDGNQLHQAIMNLCINAQHAMQGVGEIRISARSEILEEDRKAFRQEIPAGKYLIIEISDTGVGINPGDLPHVFEPFFTTKPQGEGTGLGLAMVYRIIRAHDGYIDLHTEAGEGTTFTIYLQANEQPERQVSRIDRLGTPMGHGEKILLVDDDDMVLDASKNTLERLGYEVHAYRSSLKALEAFKSDPEKWDLLFTDLSMPEMDGARLGARIRQQREDLAIILYTGYLDAVDAIELDNLRILPKPSRMDDIASAVATALAKQNVAAYN